MYDVVIIGAGPAGVAAAIQLKRSGHRLCVVESAEIGGLLHHAHCVENYPGFATGLHGKVLAQRLEAHLNRFNVEIHRQAVTGLTRSDQWLCVHTPSAVFEARYVIAATGTQPRKWCDFDLPSGVEKRIFYDPREAAKVDGDIVIIGGGDAAFDYALRLAGTREVIIIHRHAPRALPLLVRRVDAHGMIRRYQGGTVRSIETDSKELAVIGTEETVRASAVVIAIGRVPDTRFLGADAADWKREPRLYWAGDVINERYRQAVIAAGDGLRTAMKISERLEGNV